MAHPKGTKVRQVVPAIEGEVVDRRLHESGEIEYLVGYSVGEEQHERWFLASQVAVVEVTA